MAAPVLGTVSTVAFAGAFPMNWSVPHNSTGADALLFFLSSSSNLVGFDPTVTFNGKTATLVKKTGNASSGGTMWVFCLPNPGSATANAVASNSNNYIDWGVMTVVSVLGCDTTTPILTSVADPGGTSGSVTLTMTTTGTDSLIVSTAYDHFNSNAFVVSGSPSTPTIFHTGSANNGNHKQVGAYTTRATPGSVTHTLSHGPSGQFNATAGVILEIKTSGGTIELPTISGTFDKTISAFTQSAQVDHLATISATATQTFANFTQFATDMQARFVEGYQTVPAFTSAASGTVADPANPAVLGITSTQSYAGAYPMDWQLSHDSTGASLLIIFISTSNQSVAFDPVVTFNSKTAVLLEKATAASGQGMSWTFYINNPGTANGTVRALVSDQFVDMGVMTAINVSNSDEDEPISAHGKGNSQSPMALSLVSSLANSLIISVAQNHFSPMPTLTASPTGATKFFENTTNTNHYQWGYTYTLESPGTVTHTFTAGNTNLMSGSIIAIKGGSGGEVELPTRTATASQTIPAFNTVVGATPDTPGVVHTTEYANNYTASVTVGTGNNRGLLVALINRNPDNFTAVTYGGTALTKVGSSGDVDKAGISLWVLDNPPSGTANLVVTLDDFRIFTVITQVLYGVVLPSMVDSFSGASGNTVEYVAPSTTITTVNASTMIYEIFTTTNDTGTATLSDSGSQILNVAHPDSNVGKTLVTYRNVTTAGAHTVSRTLTPIDNWAQFLAGVKTNPYNGTVSDTPSTATATAAQTIAAFTPVAQAGVLVGGTASRTIAVPAQTTVGKTLIAVTAAHAPMSFTQSATSVGYAVVIATATQSLGVFGQVASAIATVSVSGTNTLPAFTDVGQAKALVGVTTSATLVAFSQASDSDVLVSASSARAVADFTQTVSTTQYPVISATASQSIPAFAQVAASKAVISGSTAQTIAAFSETAAAMVTTNATATHTIAAFTQTVTTNTLPLIVATASQSLVAFSGLSEVDVTISGSSSRTIAAVTSLADVDAKIVATATQGTANFTQAGNLSAVIATTAQQTLAAFTQVASSSIGVGFSAFQQIPNLTSSTDVDVHVQATSARSISALSSNALVGVSISSATSTTFANFSETTVVKAITHATATNQVGEFTQDATIGRPTIVATSARTIAPVASSGSGTVETHATASMMIEPFIQVGGSTYINMAFTAQPQQLGTFSSNGLTKVEIAGSGSDEIESFVPTTTVKALANASLSKTIPAFTSAGQVQNTVSASSAPTIAAFSRTASGKTVVSASADQTISGFTQDAGSGIVRRASATQVLGDFAQATDLDLIAKVSAPQALLAPFDGSGQAQVTVSASGARTIGSFGSNAAASVTVSGSAAQVAGNFAQSAISKLQIAATAAQGLSVFSSAAVLKNIAGTQQTTLVEPFIGIGEGTVVVAASALRTIDPFSASAGMAVLLVAQANQTIAGFIGNSVAKQILIVTGDQTFPDFASNGRSRAVAGIASETLVPDFQSQAAGRVKETPDLLLDFRLVVGSFSATASWRVFDPIIPVVAEPEPTKNNTYVMSGGIATVYSINPTGKQIQIKLTSASRRSSVRAWISRKPIGPSIQEVNEWHPGVSDNDPLIIYDRQVEAPTKGTRLAAVSGESYYLNILNMENSANPYMLTMTETEKQYLNKITPIQPFTSSGTASVDTHARLRQRIEPFIMYSNGAQPPKVDYPYTMDPAQISLNLYPVDPVSGAVFPVIVNSAAITFQILSDAKTPPGSLMVWLSRDPMGKDIVKRWAVTKEQRHANFLVHDQNMPKRAIPRSSRRAVALPTGVYYLNVLNLSEMSNKFMLKRF